MQPGDEPLGLGLGMAATTQRCAAPVRAGGRLLAAIAFWQTRQRAAMELRPVAFLLVESVAYPSARLTAFIGASAAPVGEAAVVAGDVLASVPEGPSSGAPSPLGSGVIGGLSSPPPRG